MRGVRKMSEEENRVEEMKEEFTKFYNTYLYLLDASQYLRTDEALTINKAISLLKNLVRVRWGAELRRQDVKTVLASNKLIVITDVYRAEPYSHEYHIVKATYHAEIDEKGEARHVLDGIETMEEVDIDEVNTSFTSLLQQLVMNELEEMREPWRTEINDAIMRLAFAETQGELEEELENLEARLRSEPILEYIVFLDAIRRAKEEYSKKEQ
jgi:hypothetical protein